MSKDRITFSRELPQKTLTKLKALSEHFSTTEAQALVKAIDIVASQERVVLFHTESAKQQLERVPQYQLAALQVLLEGKDSDQLALAKLKARLGKRALSDAKFRQYVLIDLNIDASDFELC